MRFVDWKKEDEHVRGQLNRLGAVSRRDFVIRESKPSDNGYAMQVNGVMAAISATAFIWPDGEFSLRIQSLQRGNDDDLGKLTKDELLKLVEIHDQIQQWIDGKLESPPGYNAR